MTNIKTKTSVTGMRISRPLGIFLTLVSAFLFSTAGIFTKSVTADALSVIFWRGIFGGIAGLAFLLATGRLETEIRGIGRVGWFLALINASGTIAFITAFKLTSVAHVTLIWSTVPIVGGIIGWIWLRERVSIPFMLACLMVMGGVALLFDGDFGGGGMIGNLLAFWMTVMMAMLMAVYRRYPHAPTTLPAILAAVMLILVAIIGAEPLAVGMTEIGILAMFGIIFYAASLTIAAGSKHIAPGEAGLLSVVETPSAILLALVILGEVPGSTTLIGGAIIMASVLWYQWRTLRSG